MGFGEVLVAIVAMGCGTGIVVYFLDTIKAIRVARHNAGRSDPALQETLRQLRDEMAQLRHSTNDVVLTFDTTLQRLDARLQHVEQNALGSGPASGALPGMSRGVTRSVEEQQVVAPGSGS